MSYKHIYFLFWLRSSVLLKLLVLTVLDGILGLGVVDGYEIDSMKRVLI